MTFRDEIDALATLLVSRDHAQRHIREAMECEDGLVMEGVYDMHLRRWRACVADAAAAQAYLDEVRTKGAA